LTVLIIAFLILPSVVTVVSISVNFATIWKHFCHISCAAVHLWADLKTCKQWCFIQRHSASTLVRLWIVRVVQLYSQLKLGSGTQMHLNCYFKVVSWIICSIRKIKWIPLQYYLEEKFDIYSLTPRSLLLDVLPKPLTVDLM
jgi:hypothetical protein